MATTSKRQRRFQSFFCLRYDKAARVTRACFSTVTDSAGWPASIDCRVRTSTNTIVSPSIAIRSISPTRLATPRPIIRSPFFFRKAAARASPFLPSSPRSQLFMPAPSAADEGRWRIAGEGYGWMTSNQEVRQPQMVHRRLFGGRLVLLFASLGEAGRLADPLLQVVELGAADATVTLHVELGDFWRVDREAPLDAFAGDDSPHGEHFGHAPTATGRDDAGIDLDPLFAALEDPGVDVDRVTD